MNRPSSPTLVAPPAWTVALGLSLLALPALATGWQQHRGPQRDGTTPATGLAAQWPASGPKELWRRPLGAGFAAVVAEGGRAYAVAAEGEEEAVLAFDAKAGSPLWRTVIGTPTRSEFGDGPRATPTLAGGRLYTVSSTSHLVALDAVSGKLLWKQDLTRFDPVPRFGYAMSPLVTDGMVIVEVGTKDLVTAERVKAGLPAEPPPPDPSAPPEPPPFPPPVGAVAAFDATTGALRWRGGFPGPPSYASPVVAELAGVRQLIYSRGTQVAGVGLDGTLLWRHETPPRSAIATPLLLDGDTIFVSTSDDSFGGHAIRVRRDDTGQWQTEERWSERLMRNHFNASVVVGEELYGFDNATFKCLDRRSGERRWAQRGFGKGSLLAAGNLLYVLSDDGMLALVEASPEAYRERGRVQAMSGKSWTAPSLADGIVYLRDHDEIVAYDVRATTLSAVPGTSESAATVASAGVPGTSGTGSAAVPSAEVPGTSGTGAPTSLGVDEILARHAAARGGKERWEAVRALELAGTYSAFSEQSPFVLVRMRGDAGDLFRLDYSLPAGPAVRANDASGPWLQHPFLSPEPVRLADVAELAPYRPQMLREARITPLLIEAQRLGLTIERIGAGEVLGKPTLDLRVTFPADGETPGAVETWHLDPTTFLEVAVDSQVLDYTQGGDPFLQRAYYADFRSIDGVVVPFRVDLEFNARVEAMEVETVRVDPAVDVARFAPPPPAAAEPTTSSGG